MTLLLPVPPARVLAATALGAVAPPPADQSITEAVGFLAGEWAAAFDPPAAGARPTPAIVSTRWGRGRSWLESDVTVAQAAPPYAVHIVIAFDRPRRRPVAYAVNTLAPAPIAYEGEVPEPGRVVFTGAVAGRWQRVSYGRVDRDHLDFLVEAAATPDGPWALHSHAALVRLPRTGAVS